MSQLNTRFCGIEMPDSEITPEILELILRTSRVKGCQDLYSLAPRGHRIGIYFQQRRAILLAAALRTRLGREQLADCRIGIVGGGVSGLTFLLAMKNQGANNVFLFEAEDEILTIGAAASHRHLHPNYNRWPMLGSMDIFTSLPTLNWHAGSADKVFSQMRTQARTDYQDLIKDSLKTHHTAKQVIQRSSVHAEPLSVLFQIHNGEKREDFEIVVIAAGFSTERGSEWGCGEYWTRDLENFDVGEHKRPVTVYGSGDGALIDIIRSCAAKPNEAWQIPLGTIARLRLDEAVAIPNDSMNDIDPRFVSFSFIEKKIQSHEESIRCIAWGITRADEAAANGYAEEEARFYRERVDELKTTLVDFLEDQLKPVANEVRFCPVIVGALEHPFEPTSAPINKLLLAYLLETKRVVYDQRNNDVSKDELQRRNNKPTPQDRNTIVICRFGAAKNFPLGSGAAPPRGIPVFVESDGTNVSITETETEAHLIDALSGVTGGEYVYFEDMPHPLTQARHGLDADRMTNEMRRQNEPIITSFAREHLNTDEVEFVPGDSGTKPKWVVKTTLTDNQITEKLISIGGMDGNFCGAPIVVAKFIDKPRSRGF